MPTLVRPIEVAQHRLTEIQADTGKEANRIHVHGALIFGVATFETMVLDILRYYLQCLPQKLDFKDAVFRKEEVLDLRLKSSLVRAKIEKSLSSLFYKRLSDLMSKFSDYLEISELDENLLGRLVEIKETRNLLLHNNLVTNSLYLEKAGSQKRSNSEGHRLEVDQADLKQSIEVLLEAIDYIDREVRSKYADYSRMAAIRRLWSWCFSSPLMQFDDFWRIDEGEGKISSLKEFEKESCLASSEELVLGLWRMIFLGRRDLLKNFSLRALDEKHKAMVFFLLSIDQEYDLY